MSTPSIDASVGALRELLDANTPDARTRAELYALLTALRRADAEAYDGACLAYLEPFEEWWAEPLVWSTLDCWAGYGQGLRSQEAPSLGTYREVMPFGPYQLEIESVSHHDMRNGGLLGGDVPDTFDGCVGLKVDGATVYDGSTSQEFYEATVRCDDLVSALLVLFDRLPDLRRFEFIMPLYADQYTFSGEHPRPREVALSRSKRQALFKQLRTRHALTSLTFSHDLLVKGFHGFRQKHWAGLEELDLRRNELESSHPKDAPIAKLFPDSMPRLRRLSFQGCVYLTDASFAALEEAVSFPALEVVDLRGTRATEATRALLEPSAKFPSLEEVILPKPRAPRA